MDAPTGATVPVLKERPIWMSESTINSGAGAGILIFRYYSLDIELIFHTRMSKYYCIETLHKVYMRSCHAPVERINSRCNLLFYIAL